MTQTHPQKNIFLKSPYFSFNVESVATVKGLKKVSSGYFPNTTMKKITSANESEIDSLAISSGTKTAFHTAITDGKTIFTPTKPVTYGEWQGLFYITTNFNDEASYIIGEGLNGGYSVCGLPGVGGLCQWTQNFFDLLVPTAYASGITATITANPAVVFVGQTVNIVITYVWKGISWVKNFVYNAIHVGVEKITPQYVPSVSTTVTINDTPKIGTVYNDHDTDIIEKANKYGIPKGILKAIIHRETRNNLFDPRTSRYEPKRDYQDFQVTNPPAGRGMSNAPFSYYILAGKNAQGATLTDGTRVSSLPRNYRTTLKSVGNGGWQYRGIVTTDRPPLDGVITVAELYANDYDLNQGAHSQGWPAFGVPASYTGNFTPQFLISSSYGLGHVMYAEATETRDPQGNRIMEDSHSPHDIVDDVDLGVELSAAVLKGKFSGLISNDNCNGWSQAVTRYNADPLYRKDVCEMSQGIYK